MVMNRNIFVLYILLLSSLLYACNNDLNEKDAVLEIGSLTVTRPEYERAKNKENVTYKNLEEWKPKYISKCLIIADGLAMRYDTISELKKTLMHTGNYMMIKKNGDLWNATIAPKIKEQPSTPEDIERRKKVFYFDYTVFTEGENVVNYTNKDSTISNSTEFYDLQKTLSKTSLQSGGSMTAQWPFPGFSEYKEYIYTLNEGDISKLLFVNNRYMFLHLTKTEEIILSEKDKYNLAEVLKLEVEREVVRDDHNEMLASCRPVINQAGIDTIVQFLNKGNTIFEFDQNLDVVQYYINDTLKKGNFDSFIEYYSHLLMRSEINDESSLKRFVTQYYNDDYLVSKAKELGLFDSLEFITASQVYYNNLIHNHYIENEIKNNLTIDTLSVKNYYKSNKDRFTQNKYATIDIYLFSYMDDAIKNQTVISNLINANPPTQAIDKSVIDGLLDFKPAQKIDMEITDRSSMFFVKKVQSMQNGELSPRPVRYGNKYAIVYKKNESGLHTKELSEVYSDIESLLLRKMAEEETEKVVEKLATIYPVEINKLE